MLGSDSLDAVLGSLSRPVVPKSAEVIQKTHEKKSQTVAKSSNGHEKKLQTVAKSANVKVREKKSATKLAARLVSKDANSTLPEGKSRGNLSCLKSKTKA